MPTAINKIVDSFLFPTISPIIRAPNYETIAKVHLKLNSNAASVQSNLKCGTLDLIHLIICPAVYATLSATAFVAPVNPGAEATIPLIASGPQITNLQYTHDIDTVVFNEYKRTYKALRQMLIAAVDKMFIRSLRHRYVGYGTTTTTRSILDHVYATYVKISLANLQDNDAQLRGPYYANLPIKVLINQVEGAAKYAAAGNTPYIPLQVVFIAYQLIFQTGILTNDCKQWKRRDPADKTWTQSNFFCNRPPRTA